MTADVYMADTNMFSEAVLYCQQLNLRLWCDDCVTDLFACINARFVSSLQL